MSRHLIIYCIAIFWLPGLGGQLFAQFHLNGAAQQSNDSCWVLTTEGFSQVGSIWNQDKISLNESFQVIMELYFGCKDSDGADGILFGFQPLSTSIGQSGEGIGFQGVAPSLGIEFDTWQNGNLNDPNYDHIAICKNGVLNHASGNNLAGPVQASSSQNIEDCQWHKLRVNWDAPSQTLEVWFDCQKKLSYTADIVNDIFNGNPNVFWGFTAATGGAFNLQQVCYGYTTFLDGFEDVVICPGGQFQLSISGGVSYHWTPSTGLSNPNIPNPIAKPEATTTYYVEGTDACNNPFFDSITVFVDGDTVFFDLGNDTTLCEGQSLTLDATSYGTDTVVYSWRNGAATPVVEAVTSGTYSVTVTIDNYCVADDRVKLLFIELPQAPNLNDTTLCLGSAAVLYATSPGNPTYLWQDGSTADSLNVSASGLYTVAMANSCGEASASAAIDFEDCRQVYFPTAFSPNDDGFNDVFLPFDDGDVAEIRSLKVFDRWGELVFERNNFLPNDFAAGWDGTFKGKISHTGLYVWVSELTFRDLVQETLEGEVLLLK
jgi:gliding motility-associated-like protein